MEKEDSDLLSVSCIRSFLSNPIRAGQIVVYSVLESTNTTALEMAASGAAHGTVVIANSQTAGRGRRGRFFYSPSGRGIYMSVVLRPKLLPFNSPELVTIFAAVAVCKTIELISIEQEASDSPNWRNLRIKWVNDIFLNGKKICGILTEVAHDTIVVGIGINFTAPSGGYPKELDSIPGALFEMNHVPISKSQFIADIINHLDCPPTSTQILKDYKERLIMLDRAIIVHDYNSSYMATALDVDDTGGLIVRNTEGKIQTLVAGEISITF